MTTFDPQLPPMPQPPKRRSKAPLIILGVIVGLLVICGGAGTLIALATSSTGKPDAVATHHASAGKPAADEPTPDDSPTGPAQLSAGDTATLTQEDLDATTADVTVSTPAYGTGPIDEYSEGPQNGVFVVFTVTVKATAGKFEFNPDDLYIVGADGTRSSTGDGNSYEATSDDPLTYSDVNAGEHVEGPVPFDVKGRHGELVYDPNLDGGPLVEWKF